MRAALLAASVLVLACSSSDSGEAAGAAGAAGAGSGAAGAAGGAGNGGGAGQGPSGAAGAAGSTGGGAAVATYAPPVSLANDLRYPSRVALAGGRAFVTEYVPPGSPGTSGIAVVSMGGAPVERVAVDQPSAIATKSDQEVWFASGKAPGAYVVNSLATSSLTVTGLYSPPQAVTRELLFHGDEVATLNVIGELEVRDAALKQVVTAKLVDVGLFVFFKGAYLVGDFAGKRIARVDPTSGAVTTWATGVTAPYALTEHDGLLVVGDEDVSGGSSGRLLAFDGDGQQGALKEVLATGLGEILRVVSFGGELFWTSSGPCSKPPFATDGKVFRRSAEGKTTSFDGEACARSVVVDASGVTWLTRSESGSGALRFAKRTN